MNEIRDPFRLMLLAAIVVSKLLQRSRSLLNSLRTKKKECISSEKQDPESTKPSMIALDFSPAQSHRKSHTSIHEDTRSRGSFNGRKKMYGVPSRDQSPADESGRVNCARSVSREKGIVTAMHPAHRSEIPRARAREQFCKFPRIMLRAYERRMYGSAIAF